MTAVGGSIQSVTVDGQIFNVTADADSQRDLGGFSNDVQADGGGGARIIKTRKTWMVDGLTISIDDSRGEAEFLQDRANAKSYYPITIEYASGAVYQGSGIIKDDLQVSSQNQTASVNFAGPGYLTRQQ